jgi:hypothetical protein
VPAVDSGSPQRTKGNAVSRTIARLALPVVAALAALAPASPALAAVQSESRYVYGVTPSATGRITITVPTTARKGKVSKVRVYAGYMSQNGELDHGVTCELSVNRGVAGRGDAWHSLATWSPTKAGSGDVVAKFKPRFTGRHFYNVFCTVPPQVANRWDDVDFKVSTKVGK